MLKVGIIGASGYSGEVLLELLARHPQVESLVVASRSNTGELVERHMPRLAGLLDGVCFVAAEPEALAALAVDVWFLALPHGVATQFALPLLAAGRLVIDLSADFRLTSAELYQRYYGEAHTAPHLLPSVPYVLPELTEGWRDAQLIACPGCYPSSILFPLIPLFRQRLLPARGISIFSLSGVSGAGKKADFYYSYTERTESALAYGLGKHRHLSEIEEQLSLAAEQPVTVQFTPHLVPMLRGIATTITVPVADSVTVESVYAAWQQYYHEQQGIRLLPTGQTPETRNVVGRNRVDFSAIVDRRTGNLLITSAIDNLMKGASSQAVQIMNLRLGLDGFCGLI